MASIRNSASPDLLGAALAASLARHLSCHQQLMVGLSGGRDSVALLHSLKAVQHRFDFSLSACHVNHNINTRALEWQDFCQRICTEWGIPLIIKSIDVPRTAKEGMEAAARNGRYVAYAELSADWVLLAQHRGDLAETMLYNIIRGSGLAGMAGIPETRTIRPGLRLLRPFLSVDRSAIDSYLQQYRLEWIDDDSNLDTRFSRNFLRHEILPVLISRFPAAERKLASASSLATEAKMLLDELAQLDLGEYASEFPVPIACFSRLTEPRSRNLLRYLLAKSGAGIPSEERLFEAVRQLREAGSDKRPTINFGDKQLYRKRGKVYLAPLTPDSPALAPV